LGVLLWLWAAMEKLGVPPTVLSVLKALHAKVDVKFDVDGVEKNLESIIGVKQGDILGSVLFLFFVAAFQMAWRKVQTTTKPPALFTKPDGVLHGRNIDEGEAEKVELSETLYADDTVVHCSSRERIW
jgi:hypothetical protein